MSLRFLTDFCKARNIEMRPDEPLSRHTSLRIGGPAMITLFPDETSLREIVALLVSENIPYTVLGKGTNVLVRDEGIGGAVVFTERMRDMALEHGEQGSGEAGEVRMLVQPGCELRKLLGHSLRQGLSGVEGLAGIPGTVGGAIVGNAGSFGYEMKDVLVSTTLLLSDGTVRTLSGGEIGFGYRSTCLPKESFVLGSVVSLRRDDPREVRERIRGYLAEKKTKQPIGRHSAGCVFKNPGGTPAGRLIDEAGCKGMRIGGIEVSTHHANFFVNRGGGRADDFLGLMDSVREKVNRRFGILLEPEIRIIGGEDRGGRY